MAKRSFIFRLQRLLEIRELRERQEQQKLLALQVKLQEEERRLDVLNNEEYDLVMRLSLKPGERLDIQDRVATVHALEKKRKEKEAQRKKITQAEQAVAVQQDVLKQARIDVKSLEKLREKQLEEFKEEMLREQAVYLDDISSQGYARQRRNANIVAAEDLGLDEIDEDLIEEARQAATLEEA
jgi:flagellar FliJ protein